MTKLPPDMSYLNNLYEIDLINNPIKDFTLTIDSLATLPKLNNLKISIDKQEEALLVLQSLPTLKYLNNKPTKQSPSFEIDIEDSEVDNISLDHELENFQQLFNIIQAKLEDMNSEHFSDFSQQFQNLLNKEIEIINEYLDSSVPNFIYGTKILNSKLKVFNFFNDVIVKIDKENSLNSTLIQITEFKNKAIFDLEDINKKMLVQVTNFQNRKNNKSHSSNFNTNNNNNVNDSNAKERISHLNNIIEQNEETLKYYESLINQLREDNENKANEIQSYIDNENALLEKTAKLELENKTITEKMLYQTKNMIDNSNSNVNNNYNNNNNNNYSNYNSNNYTQSTSKLPPTTSIIISPSGAKVLTKKMLLEIIDEIYASKTNFDKISSENKMPKETMEQHMYTYLNYKYGLKNLIIEWAVSIINAIKTFSAEDSQVLLFGKILKNEIEEDFRFTFEKLKKTIRELLQVSI